MSIRADFLDSPGWQLLSQRIAKTIEDVTEAALLAQNFPEMRYNAGFRDALRSVLALPHQVLRGTDEKSENDERLVQNHPKINTGQW